MSDGRRDGGRVGEGRRYGWTEDGNEGGTSGCKEGGTDGETEGRTDEGMEGLGTMLLQINDKL